jgi:hypothetical protein
VEQSLARYRSRIPLSLPLSRTIKGKQKRLRTILNAGHEQEAQPITTNRNTRLRTQLKKLVLLEPRVKHLKHFQKYYFF